MTYTYTTQREVLRAFWRDNPQLNRKKITDFSGNGKIYVTDTRCAFVDYVDHLARNGDISESLADRVTL